MASRKIPGMGRPIRPAFSRMLMIVVIAHEMDVLLGISYIRDAVVIGFCANEIISILENAGLMGLPIPGIFREAIDQLKRKEGK